MRGDKTKSSKQLDLFAGLAPEAKRLLESFEVVAEAPGGMKMLRDLVSQLALLGRMSPGIKSQEVLNNYAALPTGWHWRSLEETCSFIVDSPHRTPKYSLGGEYLALRPRDVAGGILRIDTAARVDRIEYESQTSRHAPGEGDIVYSRELSFGWATRIPDSVKACLSQGMVSMRPIADVFAEYLVILLNSPIVRTQALNAAVGAAHPHVNLADIRNFRLPIPPFTEQGRIITKIHELMRLCDDLEARQNKQRETATRLTTAALGALTSAEGPKELAASWELVTQNYEALFDRPDSIAYLRAAVLDLAVSGRLAPQEPESKTPTSASQPATITGPFPLPATWHWHRLANLVDPDYPISYGVLVPGPDVEAGIPFVRIQDLSINNPSPLPNKRIAPNMEEKYARTRLVGGELLLGVVGSIGKVGIAPNTWKGANIARAVCRIMPHQSIYSPFLAYVIQSAFVQNYFGRSTRTLAQPTLNVAMIREAPIPLPPFAEQKRIVAKVDQLMSLCDALEATLRRSEDVARKLADALVAELLA